MESLMEHPNSERTLVERELNDLIEVTLRLEYELSAVVRNRE